MQNNPLFQKTGKQRAGKTEKEILTKRTYYLPEETVKTIEKIRYDLISKHGREITKSKIIETAVDLIDKNLEAKQQNSILLKHSTIK